MARCLIVGCGCGGRALARTLVAAGHAVRGTTRDPQAREQIEAAGAEAFLGDPDRVATLAPALEHVSVACLLLGGARGTREELLALHGSRLEMLLSRMLDSTVRGVVYEAAGDVPSEILRTGAERVSAFCEGSRIPYSLLRVPRSDEGWTAAAFAAIESVLGAGGRDTPGRAPRGRR